ncbi:MAG: hypothetical protein SFV15_17560 [Polyangiaceae bacterium]|nr:hypothetical protein [Polyangiaceae bacterium]
MTAGLVTAGIGMGIGIGVAVLVGCELAAGATGGAGLLGGVTDGDGSMLLLPQLVETNPQRASSVLESRAVRPNCLTPTDHAPLILTALAMAPGSTWGN